MAGPAQQTPLSLVVPPGEAQVLYSPSALAYEVKNFEMTSEGTLKTVTGPCPYEVDRGGGYQDVGTPHGLFHAGLLGGVSDMLLLRAGTTLYRHAGWDRNWESLLTGLTDDDRPGYPDQFVVLNDNIIWTNGVDRAQVISHDGMVVPLGFDYPPGAPTALSPDKAPTSSRAKTYANTDGYSWPGRIGTLGDLLDGETGSILAGSWYYYLQYEDIHGNLSPLSAASNTAAISTMQADPYDIGDTSDSGEVEHVGSMLDDLTRQFMVQIDGVGPDHTIAMLIHRTPDTRSKGTEPKFLVRLGGNAQFRFPDTLSDAELGSLSAQMATVPVFRVMCTHQGSLIIANTPDDPGIVRRSQVGFPGTFPEADWVYPDSGGAEVTALTSHDGVLLAFTESSVYSLEVFEAPRPLAQGIGCVAPRSIKALPDGTLVWLGRDGFYGMRGQSIGRLSGPIDRTVRNYINRGRVRKAVAAMDWESGEYRCAVTPAGETDQKFIFCFDGAAWRRQELGLDVRDICSTDDWRIYTLIAGREEGDAKVNPQDEKTIQPSTYIDLVYVLGHEIADYTPPARSYVYRSGWMRGDDVGLTPVHVRTIFLGMLDSHNSDFTIRFYRNGSWKEVVQIVDVKAVGPDDDSSVVVDTAGVAVIGAAKAHDPRLFWRQVPVGLENSFSWAFEIEATPPTRLHLAAFSFYISVATSGSPRGRVPQRADV